MAFYGYFRRIMLCFKLCFANEARPQWLGSRLHIAKTTAEHLNTREHSNNVHYNSKFSISSCSENAHEIACTAIETRRTHIYRNGFRIGWAMCCNCNFKLPMKSSHLQSLSKRLWLSLCYFIGVLMFWFFSFQPNEQSVHVVAFQRQHFAYSQMRSHAQRP